jgi:hypothetical protein
LFLRFRAVQPINPADIRTRHEMPIQIHGDLDGAVSELISHIGQARSRLNQQGSVRVTKIMDPEVPKSCFLDCGEEVP